MRGVKFILFGSFTVGFNMIPHTFFQQLTMIQLLGVIIGVIVVSIGWWIED